MRIDIYHHSVPNDTEKLLLLILKNTKSIMKQNEQVLAFVDRLNAATNEIASDLQALRDAEKDNLAPETLTSLDAITARLEAMGQDPADPIPDEPVDPNAPV